MTELNITFKEERGDRARCGYCFLHLEDEIWRCRGCGSQLHGACYSELSCCPTLGCDEVLTVHQADGTLARRARFPLRSKVRLICFLVFDFCLLSLLFPWIAFLTISSLWLLVDAAVNIFSNVFWRGEDLFILLYTPLLATAWILSFVIARWRSIEFQENIGLSRYHFARTRR